MELTKNQAALILDASEDGEITVDIAISGDTNLAAALCQAIATKLMNDENFQSELMQMVEGNTMN